MSIIVRPADLELEHEIIIDTLFRYLTPLSDADRFDWLYRSSPHGKARVWLAIDTSRNDSIVGVASAFPRRVYVGDSEELAWVLGDFCISNQYRSLGPALKLQRACLEIIDSGEGALCYDFPSTSMMAVYMRLGINPLGQMIRMAKPLRVERKVGEYVKSSVVARMVSSAGNLLLAVSDRVLLKKGSVSISLHQGECGEEFSDLARQIGSQHGLCIQRSHEYLNWRYLDNPLYSYEFITARRNGQLLGYAVFTQAQEDGSLADLFAVDDPTVIRSLVAKLVSLLRDRGVVSLSAPVLDSHPSIPIFDSLGFKARETSPVVFYAPANMLSDYTSPGWYIMQGDRDS